LSSVDIFPGVFASKYIVNLLALELNSIFKGLLDFKHIWTRFAEEAKVWKSLLC